MKKEEIREMSTADLTERLAQMEKDYLQGRMIARVKTELRMRELNNK